MEAVGVALKHTRRSSRRGATVEGSMWRQCRGGRHGTEEERSVRHRCGGGRRGIEVDAEERASTSVWWGNDSSQG
jgi:hypothetical protein